jgi:hypothetical protein
MKLCAILAATVLAAGGGAYGLYTYTDLFGEKPADPGQCPVAKAGGCPHCNRGTSTDACGPTESAGPMAAVAAAGPVAAAGAKASCCPDGPCCPGPCCDAAKVSAKKASCCPDGPCCPGECCLTPTVAAAGGPAAVASAKK